MGNIFTRQDLTQECEFPVIIDAIFLAALKGESAGRSMSNAIPKAELMTISNMRKQAGLCANTHT